MVGPPPVASSTARAPTKRKRPVRTSIIRTPAMDFPSAAWISATARCSSSRRIGRAHTCSISRLMISMPVRSPLCTVRSKVWPEGLAVQRAVGVAVEEAADLVLQLVHPLDRLGDERPRHLLVGQPLAALDGV